MVYTSARTKVCDENEIKNILNSCKKNNPGHSVTGVLVHSDKRFIQVIEGDKLEIETLYEKIKLDKRHAGLNIRVMEPTNERHFGGWHMAFLDVEKKDIKLNMSIGHQDRELFQSIVDGSADTFNEQSFRVLRSYLDWELKRVA